MNSCALSELDLFSKPIYQTSVLSSKWVQYTPTVDYEKGNLPINIKIIGSNQDYIDLSNIFLYMKVGIKKDEKYILINDKIGPVNNFFHSIFKQVIIKLNDKTITQTSTTYPYRAYIENLLNYGTESKETHLQTVMFIKDDSNNMNNFEVESTKIEGQSRVINPTNKGFLARRKYFLDKKCEMYGRLHCDIFNVNKFLMNDINIEVELHKTDEDFCLLGESGWKVEISDLFLNVKKIKISPDVILAQAMALEKGNAKYPMTRVVVESKSIKKGSTEEILENLARGPIPKRLIIAFVEASSFSGKLDKNPFNFQNFKLSEINLSVDGEQIPYQPLKFDFSKSQYIQGYYSLVNSNNLNIFKSGNDITLDDYKNGYTLISFDLSPDSCLADHNIDKYGNLRLCLKFEEELKENISVILYHEYNSVLEINKLKEVKYDLF